MTNFGLALKRFRANKAISQSDFVNMITEQDGKLSGIDVVTISRWENDVIIPSHKRQIEVFRAAGQCYFDFIMKNRDLIIGEVNFRGLKNAYVWENSESIDIGMVSYREIRTSSTNGTVSHCLLYTDENGIPVGQMSFKFVCEEHFWTTLRKKKKPINISGKKDCIIISSVFCLSEEIIIHMIGIIVKELLSRNISNIGFRGDNKKSNTKRFLKSIGFKIHCDNSEFSSLVLTYYDALFNRELFLSALLITDNGIKYEK